MPKTCWRLAEKNTSFLTFFWWLYIARHSFYTSHYVLFCFLFFKKVQYALGWLTHCYHSVPLTCDFKKQKMVDGEASKQFCENQIDNFWSFIYNVTLKSLHWSAHRLWNPQFQDLPSNTESVQLPVDAGSSLSDRQKRQKVKFWAALLTPIFSLSPPPVPLPVEQYIHSAGLIHRVSSFFLPWSRDHCCTLVVETTTS